jgi:Domain of unknown function (DUF6316)
MEDRRKEDLDRKHHWFRSESRLFSEQGEWYFETRERGIEGPYGSRLEAERMLESYVMVMRSRFAPSTEFDLVEESPVAPPGGTPAGAPRIQGMR